MWRDPLDELIADLESALPPERDRFNQLPPVAEIQYWVDRVMAAAGPLRPEELEGKSVPVTLDFEDDPAFQDFLRRFTARE